MTTKTKSPAQLNQSLIAIELDGSYGSDICRIATDIRMNLTVALRSGNAAKIRKMADEAIEFGQLWDINL